MEYVIYKTQNYIKRVKKPFLEGEKYKKINKLNKLINQINQYIRETKYRHSELIDRINEKFVNNNEVAELTLRWHEGDRNRTDPRQKGKRVSLLVLTEMGVTNYSAGELAYWKIAGQEVIQYRKNKEIIRHYSTNNYLDMSDY